MTIAIEPHTLPVSPAKDPGGLARLDFAVRGGVTRLVRSETRPPLGVMRTLYLDEALPNMAFTFLINPTAGIFEGDQQRIEITLRPGAMAHVTTQAATKLFTMPSGTARQTVRLKVGEGGALEYLPDATIPFRGARFEACTDIEVHPEAVAVVGDVLAAGRSAMGENFAYGNLRYRVTAARPDGVPLFHETFELTPDRSSPAHLGVLSGYAAVGTLLLICAATQAEAMLEPVRVALGRLPARSGVSRLPARSGLVVKLLGRDTGEVRGALFAAWEAARPHLLSGAPPPLRKY